MFCAPLGLAASEGPFSDIYENRVLLLVFLFVICLSTLYSSYPSSSKSSLQLASRKPRISIQMTIINWTCPHFWLPISPPNAEDQQH